MREFLKIAEVTLGCRVNIFDTAAILDDLQKSKKVQLVDPMAKPDVYLINTCAVTEGAERDCRNTIRKYQRLNPTARFIVTGCYAQLKPEEIAKNFGVDFVVGTTQREKIPELITQMSFVNGISPQIHVQNIMKLKPKIYNSLSTFTTHTRAFLKIQDGCNEFCTFCIIPFTRGRSRIVPISVVIDQINNLVLKGFKEVVLTGIHLGDYRNHFVNSIEALEKTDLKRFRLSSLEPFDVTDDLLTVLSQSSKFCPYFHLPLQSGDDFILKRMKRPYTTQFFKDLVGRIETLFPHVFIGLDLMLGFPGEDEESYQRTKSFLQSIFWSKAHVFPYSVRKGTSAASFKDQIPSHIKKKRVREMIALSDERLKAFYSRNLNLVLPTLIETSHNGIARGLTSNYIPVSLRHSETSKNDLIPVKLLNISEDKKLVFAEKI